MKIKLSKSQWQMIGKQSGWMKTALNAVPVNPAGNANPPVGQSRPLQPAQPQPQPQPQQPPPVDDMSRF